jgi:hypothetical protein
MIKKVIKIKHPEYLFTISASVEWNEETQDASIVSIKFGLPLRATKLEKLLFKFVQIYGIDVMTQNFFNFVLESTEYKKFIMKNQNGQQHQLRKTSEGRRSFLPV